MLAMYEVVDARQPGAISSVTQHPPTISRRSRTRVEYPERARYAAAVSPLWPAPMTTASNVDFCALDIWPGIRPIPGLTYVKKKKTPRLKNYRRPMEKAIEKCFGRAVSFVDRRSRTQRVGHMEGIASSLAKPTQMRRDGKPRPRSETKRARIVEVAIRHFAERGYSAARVEDIAAQLGLAKGSVFQHFKSKDGLFFEAYKKAVLSFPKYMQAPPAVQELGLFDVLRYWLAHGKHGPR